MPLSGTSETQIGAGAEPENRTYRGGEIFSALLQAVLHGPPVKTSMPFSHALKDASTFHLLEEVEP